MPSHAYRLELPIELTPGRLRTCFSLAVPRRHSLFLPWLYIAEAFNRIARQGRIRYSLNHQLQPN